MIRAQVLKHLLRERRKGGVRKRATAREVMEKSWGVGVIESKEDKEMTQSILLNPREGDGSRSPPE